jgi:hypothetical protein
MHRQRMNDRSTHGQMAEEGLRQKTRCSSEEKRNAGFSSFHGSKHRSTDHTKTHHLTLSQVLYVVITNHSKTDYGAYIGNGWYLKTAY